MPHTDKSTVLVAVGDCGPVHGPEEGFPKGHFSTGTQSQFASADIRLGNCERQYSDRPNPDARTQHGCLRTSMATLFAEFGFDVLTLANNHMMDAGADALLDTCETLNGLGILTTGAGRNLAASRTPAIIERNGVRVGILSWCSALPLGSEAENDRPGVAPLRVATTYEDRGVSAPVRVRTSSDPQDLEMLLSDICALKHQVDVVVLNHHAGVLWVPRVLSDYQVEVAHKAIDSGADVVLGHHPHILKGIEVYKDRPIFYSLGHFCMTKPEPSVSWFEPPWQHGSLGNHNDLDFGMPLLPYGKTARMSMIARITLNKNGVVEAGFVPVLIDNQYRPVALRPDTAEYNDLRAFVEWSSAGLPCRFEQSGDAVRILAAEHNQQAERLTS